MQLNLKLNSFFVCSFSLQVTDVDSPTGDHALIDIGKLVGLNPRAVTVRTKSRDSTSGDSQPTLIPSKYLRSNSKKIGEFPLFSFLLFPYLRVQFANHFPSTYLTHPIFYFGELRRISTDFRVHVYFNFLFIDLLAQNYNNNNYS